MLVKTGEKSTIPLLYRVGGCVRDQLLGLPASDRDWVIVGETTDGMRARGFVPVGADFPVFLHPETGEEYALARQERKTGRGYQGFVTRAGAEVTLEEDLARRDLTINAMAMDANGTIIDPFGGQEDIKNRKLRHVSPAFAEDPLRILRVARFFARFWSLGFQIAEETRVLMSQLVHSGEIHTLVAERVWNETQKALETDTPLAFFDLLHRCGALPILFPELAALIDIPQPVKYHAEGDVWTHTRMTLTRATQLSQEATVRFAALVHDLGKGTTPQSLLPHHHNHEERGVLLVNQLCDRLRIPTQFRKLAVLGCRHHLQCHRLLEMTPKKVLKLLIHLNALRETILLDHFLLVCQADATGRQGTSHTPYPQADLLRQCRQHCIGIDTQEFHKAGLQGKAFGEALHKKRLQRLHVLLSLDLA